MFRTGLVSICAAVLATVFLSTTTFALDVPLTVQEREGIARNGEIVTTGVPIAKGEIFSDQAVAIQGVDGQFQALGTWSDGSVKWLLCTFPATVPANGSSTYRLVNGSGDAAGGNLSVQQSGGTVTVSTGAARFTMVETGFDLFNEVWVDQNGNGSYEATERIVSPRTTNGFHVEDRNGNTFTSSAANYSFTVEEAGPLRAVIYFEGLTSGSAGTSVTTTGRVYAYRDQSRVDVQIAQANMTPTATTTLDQPLCRWREGEGDHGGALHSLWVEESGLRTQVDLSGGLTYSLKGRANGSVQSGALSSEANLYQDSSGGPYWFVSENVTFEGYRLAADGSVLDSGAQAEGYADVSDGSRGLTVAIRHFWQNYPNKLSVDSNGVVEVLPFPGEFSAPVEHRAGERKTHWAMFYFHAGTAAAAGSEDTAGAFHHPLRAVAPAAYYGETGAFDEFAPYDPVNFYAYEVHNEACASGWEDKRDDSDFYGWQHFGDLWSDFEGGGLPPDTNKAANNCEYDTGYAMILQACRTAGLNDDLSHKWWDLAEIANLHTADIDIYHVQSGPLRWLWGGMWNHTAHGKSGYIDPHRGDSPNTAHTWNRGMLTWYYLSGDRFVLDGGLKAGENITWRVENGPNMPGLSNTTGESRAPAHALQTTLDMYLHTWDQRYLDAARRIVNESHFDTQLYAPNYFGGDWRTKPWMVAILMKQLGRFIEVSAAETGTVETAAISSLLGYADFMEQRCYIDRNGSDPGYLHYQVWGDGTSTPGGQNVNMWTLRGSDGFTYAYRYETDPTKKARYRQIAEHSFEDGATYPWCYSCPNLRYTQTKVHQVVAGAGQEWMSEVSSGGGGGDSTPPDAIGDLSVSLGSGAGEVDLSWTAVGDDGNSGQALSYQVRRSSEEITSGSDWSAATVVSGAPIPATAGTSQSFTASGIPGGTWYFAIRAVDDGLNLGAISNSPSVTVSGGGGGGDTTPPAAIDDLLAVPGDNSGEIRLTWTAVGDDGNSGTAAAYMVKRSSSAITAGNWTSATTVDLAPSPAEPGESETMTVPNLSPGVTWYFAVRALDEVPNEGPLSNNASAAAAGDEQAPQITNVRVDETAPGTVRFRWDTNEPATSVVRYDVDYDQDGSLDQSVRNDLLKTEHSLEVTGLSAGTVWYRIRSTDGAGNLGDTSTETFTVTQTDDSAPVLSGLGATTDEAGANVIVVWNTNEPASSTVEWGPTAAYGNTETDAEYKTLHFVELSGIAQGETIHYRVRAMDPNGNEATSGDYTFTLDVDVTAPVMEDPVMEFSSSQASIALQSNEPSWGTFRWGIDDVDENTELLAAYDAPSLTHDVLLNSLIYAVTYQWEVTLSDPSGNISVERGEFLFLGTETLDTEPPAIPGGLRVAGFSPESGVVLRWAPSADVDLAGYNIYRRQVDSSRDSMEEWAPLNGNLLGEEAYVDTGTSETALYEYAISAEDASSNESGRSSVVFFNPSLFAVESLLQAAYPNPFNRLDGTEIAFQAPVLGEGRAIGAELNVYDVGGRLVKNLFDGRLEWGEGRVVQWDGTDRDGLEVSSGVYFYKLRMGRETIANKRVVLLQ